MDFLQLARERYSVRKFTAEPVSRETLNTILQAGYVAPTACNRQPWRILVLDTPEGMATLRKCTQCSFGAPAALLVCANREECWRRGDDGKTSGDIDAAIVTTHLMLEAASLGIGSTWVMYFIPEAVREEFSLPEALEPTAILVLGHPAPDARPHRMHTEYRPQEELVFWEHF